MIPMTEPYGVYPSIEELAPREIRAIVPALLMEEIEERYSTLGEKYLTEHLHPDGRRINGMMFTDRIVNCREEVVDAAFCLMGQIFKDIKIQGKEPNDAIYTMLKMCIDMYSLCVAMEELEDYWNGDDGKSE